MEEKNNNTKSLLTVKEFCEYTGIGQTKARKLIRGRNGFGVQIGNKWYVNKKKFDLWLDSQTV